MAKKRVPLAAFLTSFSSLCLLTGYEMVRSPANTLFKAKFGTENLTWVLAISPLILLGLLFLYGKSLGRFGPRRTLHGTFILSALGIVVSDQLLALGYAWAAVVLIFIREAYAVLIIEQYWSFLNSTLDEKSARKLNGPVTGLSALGGVLGGYLVGQFSGVVGTQGWLEWGALTLLPAMFFAEAAYRVGGEPKQDAVEAARDRSMPRDVLGLRLFKQHPLLGILLATILCTQVAATALDMHFQTLLQTALPDADAQTAYSGTLFMWLNATSSGIQFLIAPVVLKLFSLAAIQTAIPLINLGAILLAWMHPTLFTSALALLIFKGMDYSIFRASKEILYIPFSFDVRFRAKEVIDAFGYRFGKGGASFGLYLARTAGVAISGTYLPIAVAATALWTGLIRLAFRNKDNA